LRNPANKQLKTEMTMNVAEAIIIDCELRQ